MITCLQDFDDATVLERRILEWASPRLPSGTSRPRLDLRPQTPAVILVVTPPSRESSRIQALIELRPLLFGTAWKVLDLLLEFAFHSLATQGQTQWTIKQKQTHAKGFRGTLPGLSTEQDLWKRVCLVYDATVEARHTLIHRKLECDGTGSFINLPSPHPTVTAREQEAIQGLALYVSSIALRQVCRPRDSLIIGWYLNELCALHQLPPLPAAAEQLPEIVVIDAVPDGNIWAIDTAAALRQAQQTWHDRTYFDVEIHFPGTTLPPVMGQLEMAAQAGRTTIDLSAPPLWALP